MSQQGVLVFTKDQSLVQTISHEIGPDIPLIPVPSIQSLHEKLEQQSVRAVLVHMGKDTLNGDSPGRFIADLNDTIEHAPLFGLVDPDCPSRLRKLASRSADDCLPMPIDYERLRALLSDRHNPQNELEAIWKNVPHRELHGATRSLVTFSPNMFEMLDEIEVAARHDVSALLIGETGSGKTYLAKLIHEISERRGNRFSTVACGALPTDLIESELFGHKRGSFTGADADREGKFAATGRGTLLLDEIDVLAPDQQAKLLRVIETGEYEAVGSNDTKVSQARLIVASNYNLEDLVRAGNFRTDLYYRLNILCFRLPPLRERPLDIEFLARKFAVEHSKSHNIQLREIEPGFIDTLRAYPWPGNIREMENVIRRSVLYCKRGILTVDDLPSAIRRAASGQSPVAMPILNGVMANHSVANRPMHGDGGNPMINPSFPSNRSYYPQNGGFTSPAQQVDNRNYESSPQGAYQLPVGPYANNYSNAGGDNRFSDPNPPSTGPNIPGSSGMNPPIPPKTLEARVGSMERRIIEDSLARNNHRRKETAAELGISRVTLYNKMKKFGLL